MSLPARVRNSLCFGVLGLLGLEALSPGCGRSGHAPMAAPYVAAVPAFAPSGELASLSREQYEHVAERPFVSARDQPLSTFALDVDTASYSNVRRFLSDGSLPPKDAVRIEELVNYFDYDYPAPEGDAPLSVYAELSACPWAPAHRLLHVGLRARDVDDGIVPPRNLVFLLDVSGSMQDADKLPLLKQALSPVVRDLRAEDRVAIVVYAGSEGLLLPATSGRERATILEALESLQAGGSTNGGAGIELAYKVARESFVKGGVNRVILATDGDFNVGVSSQAELVRLIEKERDSGVYLTVLGFGTGNLQDHTMESLADHGNGNYAYLDSVREAEKVLVREAGSTLVTMAKDVKIQVELNPLAVSTYRLIGYENRALDNRDFADDRKDAGELGADDGVTALYEIVPAPAEVDEQHLRYQTGRALTAQASPSELATIAVRYQPPSGGASRLIERRVANDVRALTDTSSAYRFAAAVASFGLLLRESEHRGTASFASARALAAAAIDQDPHGDRAELLTLIDRARGLPRAP